MDQKRRHTLMRCARGKCCIMLQRFSFLSTQGTWVWEHLVNAVWNNTFVLLDYTMDEGPFEVMLYKGHTGLGMNLVGGDNGSKSPNMMCHINLYLYTFPSSLICSSLSSLTQLTHPHWYFLCNRPSLHKENCPRWSSCYEQCFTSKRRYSRSKRNSFGQTQLPGEPKCVCIVQSEVSTTFCRFLIHSGLFDISYVLYISCTCTWESNESTAATARFTLNTNSINS